MPEGIPETNLTLGGAKQYLSDNYISHTIKKTSELSFGLTVWDVRAIEEVLDTNSLRRRNFRLYTQGLEDDALAWWEATQGPTISTSPPELPFMDRLEGYIKTKIDDNTIKFGYIAQSSELTKKAICNAIMQDMSTKSLLLSEETEGNFSFEVIT